jgi:hypothetical protein
VKRGLVLLPSASKPRQRLTEFHGIPQQIGERRMQQTHVHVDDERAAPEARIGSFVIREDSEI